jgi:hypothetical protein
MFCSKLHFRNITCVYIHTSIFDALNVFSSKKIVLKHFFFQASFSPPDAGKKKEKKTV